MVTGGINSVDGNLPLVGGFRGGLAGKDEMNSFRCILPSLPHRLRVTDENDLP